MNSSQRQSTQHDARSAGRGTLSAITACLTLASAFALAGGSVVCAQAAAQAAVNSNAQARQAGQPQRLRVIVETDAGGDPDDEQSLVRFLLYTNEWDVEGIIANRPEAREGENLNSQRTGLDIVRQLVRAYEQCYPKLVQHDPRYPQPATLHQRTVSGYADSEDGMRLIITAVDANDPRPVWFLNWGTDNGSAPSSLTRALDRVLAERGRDGYTRFKARIRLSSDDQFERHTTMLDPPFPIWVDTFRPPLDGLRWYHRFSAITATAGGFDVRRDVLSGHGPIGELYPTNTTHPQKEGDTMTFLYLVPNGLGDPDHPGWGSWAGRYGRNPDYGDRPYYWANQADTVRGSTHRDHTLGRWAEDLQNDFRARLDWCVMSRDQANHPPAPVVNGQAGLGAITLETQPGAQVTLDAAGSTDPDQHPLTLHWLVYPEAGTYRGTVNVDSPDAESTQLTIPADAGGSTIHVVLVARDAGSPALARYRRVVLNVGGE